MELQHLVDEAREAMLTQGNVMPMIYLERASGVHIYALDILSDAQSIPSQCGQLARLGWEECKKVPDEEPLSIGFYAEAWRLKKPENAEEAMRPVQSQKREEIISVSHWQAKEPHNQGVVLRVTRDHKGRITDVVQEEPTRSIAIQLLSFVRGCMDAKKTDEEALEDLGRHVDMRVAQLSPKQRQALADFLQREMQ